MESLKTERINIQVTPAQKEQIKEAAKALGLTVSGLALFSIFEKIGEHLGDKIIAKIENGNR